MEDQDFKEELNEPVSPVGQYLDSTSLTLYVLAVLQFEVPIHDFPIELAKDRFLKIPRFTSIMDHDENGVKRWKSVEVKLEEHFVEPKFIDGMSVDSYDKKFFNYLSKIAMEKLPKTRPLWQVHMIKYPTSNAKGTLVFKFHHSIGDGYTLMGVVLSCLQRADNPSLPLSFPSRNSLSKPENSTCNFFVKRIPQFFSFVSNTLTQFAWSAMKSFFIEDDKTPIRSGVEQFGPGSTVISNITFSIDQIKQIKSNLGVTVNDVITGIIFYGIRLYMQDVDSSSGTLNSTALTIANIRLVKDYSAVEDMLKTTKSVWGNHITYMHVTVPKLEDTPVSNPLQFVRKAHTSIKSQKNSLAPILTSKLLLMINKIEGPEVVGKHIHKAMTNSSLLISNMAGPIEKMALANHPISRFFFTVSGMPPSLVITIMSYMGMLSVTTATKEGFIDEQKLVKYLNSAFEIIYREATKENASK